MKLTIQHNIPLHDKNWFQTGGPARYYCEPTNVQSFQEGLSWAHQQKCEHFILGQGANILISDDGFDGLVIRPHLKEINIHGTLVTAQAGVIMDDLIETTLKHNLTGLEVFTAIPGTIGGATFINLHYFEAFLSDFLVKATVVNKVTGAVKEVNKQWFNFGYDQSELMKHDYYLVDATFQLTQSSEAETSFARGRRFEIKRHRVSRYPHVRTCGSFFRNFHPEEVTLEKAGKKVIWVAYYLDKLGIKGELAVGNAAVSYQHANMIIGNKQTTSHEIVELTRLMQEKVRDAFGIVPQPECLFVGFKEYPLHK